MQTYHLTTEQLRNNFKLLLELDTRRNAPGSYVKAVREIATLCATSVIVDQSSELRADLARVTAQRDGLREALAQCETLPGACEYSNTQQYARRRFNAINGIVRAALESAKD